MAVTVGTTQTDDDPPQERALLSVTAAEAPPDAGVLTAFLAASAPPVAVGAGGVSVGWLRDEAGNATGWTATIDADETAVETAMAAWSAPPDPVETLEGELTTVLTAILTIDAESRSLAEQAALIYARMIRPDLVATP